MSDFKAHIIYRSIQLITLALGIFFFWMTNDINAIWISISATIVITVLKYIGDKTDE